MILQAPITIFFASGNTDFNYLSWTLVEVCKSPPVVSVYAWLTHVTTCAAVMQWQEICSAVFNVPVFGTVCKMSKKVWLSVRGTQLHTSPKIAKLKTAEANLTKLCTSIFWTFKTKNSWQLCFAGEVKAVKPKILDGVSSHTSLRWIVQVQPCSIEILNWFQLSLRITPVVQKAQCPYACRVNFRYQEAFDWQRMQLQIIFGLWTLHSPAERLRWAI